MGGSTEGQYNRVVGERLRRARQERRLTLSAVEALLEGRLPGQLISDWEAGERAIPVEAAAALASVYGVSLAELLATAT